MKAYLINRHLLVPRSRSSAKVNVKYKDYISQKKMAVSGGGGGGIRVSQTNLVGTERRIFREPEVLISCGSSFHSRIADGKKEFPYRLVLKAILCILWEFLKLCDK